MFFQGFLKKTKLWESAWQTGEIRLAGRYGKWLPYASCNCRESVCKGFFQKLSFSHSGNGHRSAFSRNRHRKTKDPRMEEIAWLVFQGISRVQGAVSDQLVALAAEAARYLELPVPMCGKIRKLEKKMCTDFQ